MEQMRSRKRERERERKKDREKKGSNSFNRILNIEIADILPFFNDFFFGLVAS